MAKAIRQGRMEIIDGKPVRVIAPKSKKQEDPKK